MKKVTFLVFASLALLCFASCKKNSTDVTPANNDINYDLHNRIFRVKASSTAAYTLTMTETVTGSSTVYNTIVANQVGPFDYGFTPIIGHTIKIAIRSNTGKITASVLYNGNYLDPAITVTDVSGGGSSADYTFDCKN